MTATAQTRSGLTATASAAAQAPPPPAVLLLADHLDAVLAMGEDLLTERLIFDQAAPAPVAGRSQPMQLVVRDHKRLAAFVQHARTLELAITARLVQARKIAGELRRQGPRLRPIVQIFHAGIALLDDAAAVLREEAAEALDTGDLAIGYLRQRALLPLDAPGLSGLDRIAIDERFLLLGRLPLGQLMDVVATTLDKLDLQFDLYVSRERTGLVAATDVPEGASRPLRHAADVAPPGAHKPNPDNAA